MGQYWMAFNPDKRQYIDPYCFGQFYKLAESSFVENSYMEALTHLLAGDWAGDAVMLVGDYAYDSDLCERERLLLDLEFGKDPWAMLDEDGGPLEDVSKSVDMEAAEHFRYLVCEEDMSFYDREEAPVEFVRSEAGAPGGVDVLRWDALPLLLAVGNGPGGGDYHGKNPELVGSWAGKAVRPANDVSAFEAAGFKRLGSPFCEQDVVLVASDDEISRAMPRLQVEPGRYADVGLLAAEVEKGRGAGVPALEGAGEACRKTARTCGAAARQNAQNVHQRGGRVGEAL